MLSRSLLLTALLSVLPTRVLQQPSAPPERMLEASPDVPSPSAAGEAAPLRSSVWMQQVERDIERSEYGWSRTPDGVDSAPNRSHHLRSRVSPGGLEVFPIETLEEVAGAAWRLLLRTLSFGSESRPSPLGEPRVVRSGNRIDLHYAALSEWYVNDERGIEQGWTIPADPGDQAGCSLRIEIETLGLHPEIAGDGRSAVFVDELAKVCMRYQGLRAWDATGRDVPARLVRTSNGIGVHVEQAGAQFPITVDPILTGPPWTAEIDQANAYFGASVSGAGDVNGDGFDDVIVGADAFDHGQQEEGRVFLYLGSPRGPSLSPDWTAEGDQAGGRFGASVSAGDVNGDGFDDLIVGAPEFDNGQADEGRAFVYLGSVGGPSLLPDWMVESDQGDADFGRTIGCAGDVNGDGFDDIIVGAHGLDNGQTDEGRAFLYLGSMNGPSLSPDWTAESDQTAAHFAWSVSGAGDVNGDGFDEVIVGAVGFFEVLHPGGRAFLYLGSAGGPSLTPDWTASCDQSQAAFGTSVSDAGDVNGDGFDDLIVGASWFDHGELNEGRAFLYLGSSSTPSLVPDWTAECDQAYAHFGSGVSSAGDVDGDSFDDVIIGAEYFTTGYGSEGGAFLYLGSAAGLSPSPEWTAEGVQYEANFGSSVSGAGDVDGDGLEDVIVGAPGFGHGQEDEGRAYLYMTCPALGTSYCVATAGSSGAPAEISAWCSASVAAGNLALIARPVALGQYGVFFHGRNQSQIQFGTGYLCTTGDLVRGTVVIASGYVANYTYDNSDARHSLAAQVGTTRNFQYWFRDPFPPGVGFNTSNAISVAILP